MKFYARANIKDDKWSHFTVPDICLYPDSSTHNKQAAKISFV